MRDHPFYYEGVMKIKDVLSEMEEAYLVYE